MQKALSTLFLLIILSTACTTLPCSKNFAGKSCHFPSKKERKFQRKLHIRPQQQKFQQQLKSEKTTVQQLFSPERSSEQLKINTIFPKTNTSYSGRLFPSHVQVGLLITCSLLLLAPQITHGCEITPANDVCLDGDLFEYLPEDSLVKQQCQEAEQQRMLLQQNCGLMCHLFDNSIFQKSLVEIGCAHIKKVLNTDSENIDITGKESFAETSKKLHYKANIHKAVRKILPSHDRNIQDAEIKTVIETIGNSRNN